MEVSLRELNVKLQIQLSSLRKENATLKENLKDANHKITQYQRFSVDINELRSHLRQTNEEFLKKSKEVDNLRRKLHTSITESNNKIELLEEKLTIASLNIKAEEVDINNEIDPLNSDSITEVSQMNNSYGLLCTSNAKSLIRSFNSTSASSGYSSAGNSTISIERKQNKCKATTATAAAVPLAPLENRLLQRVRGEHQPQKSTCTHSVHREGRTRTKATTMKTTEMTLTHTRSRSACVVPKEPNSGWNLRRKAIDDNAPSSSTSHNSRANLTFKMRPLRI